MAITPNMEAAICRIADRWQGLAPPWIIGGSTGLALQDVPIQAQPKDLDIYIDLDQADAFHEALRDFATDQPSYSRTKMYRSTLSHYRIEGVVVELVAGFEVHALNAAYQVRARELVRHAREIVVRTEKINVMPLSHELLFNLLRERPDRYEPIARAMQEEMADHLPTLVRILAHNHIGREWLQKIADLLQIREEDLSILSGGA